MNLFDIPSLIIELKQLEAKINESNFWENSKDSTEILRNINDLKSKIETYKKVENSLQDIIEMNKLVEEEKEESLEEELQRAINKLEKEIEKLEIDTLLFRKI